MFSTAELKFPLFFPRLWRVIFFELPGFVKEENIKKYKEGKFSDYIDVVFLG